MFAISTGLQNLLIIAGASLLCATVLAVGRSGMNLMRKRQTDQRQEAYDQRTLSEFFFDTPRDSRTGTPGKEGWTTKVDRTLGQLGKGQERTAGLLNEVLREIKPDGNGGNNFRGIVERAAEAASTEVDRQVTERGRVQRRDRQWDDQ